jgi:hypothetical protein
VGNLGPCIGAFLCLYQVTRVILGDGLKEIEKRAIRRYHRLCEIVIPPSVKMIKKGAFESCNRLTRVNLNEGLEMIGKGAFEHCTSLPEISIPSTVKAIQGRAFCRCSQLTTVNLGEGLEEIEESAFGECTSLHKISIPSTVKRIHHLAFKGSSNLTNILFCDEIEEFVTGESMREWWNHGVHQYSLITYCFMKKFNFPERLGLLPVMQWQENIHGMLRIIPTISPPISLSLLSNANPNSDAPFAMGDNDGDNVDGDWNEEMDFDAPFALRDDNTMGDDDDNKMTVTGMKKWISTTHSH